MQIFLLRINETCVYHHTIGLQGKPSCKPQERSNLDFLTGARIFLTLNMAVWFFGSELEMNPGSESASLRQSEDQCWGSGSAFFELPDPDPFLYSKILAKN
jgi:hypothetical protein